VAAPLAVAAKAAAKREAMRRGSRVGIHVAVALGCFCVLLAGGVSTVISARLQATATQPPAGCRPPAGLIPVAQQAARASGTPAAILLAVACVETGYGVVRNPEGLVVGIPADILRSVDLGKLAPDGATIAMLGIAEGRHPGNWVDPLPVKSAGGFEHALGFMQFIPSTWRAEQPAALRALGHIADPYSPLDAMTVAGFYLGRLAGSQHDYSAALTTYGGSPAYAQRVLALASSTQYARGHPLACALPAMTQHYGPVAGVYVNGLQIEPVIGGAPFHTGVDLACAAGTAVVAVAAGTGHTFTDTSGYGLSVVVVSGAVDGSSVYFRYAHLSSIAVTNSQLIREGDTLGTEGSTGLSTGPHLHFEVDRGEPGMRHLRPAAPCPYLDPAWVDPRLACP